MYDRHNFLFSPNNEAAINDRWIEGSQNGKDDEIEDNVDDDVDKDNGSDDNRKTIVNQIYFEQHVGKIVSV